MRIGIEAQRIFRGRKHGMDMVILEVLRAWKRMKPDHEFVVFVQPDEDRCFEADDQFEVVEFGASYPVWEQFKLPAMAKKHGVELLHCTSNTAPFKVDMPLVLTLHDIIYLEKNVLTSAGFTPYQRLGNMYRKWVVPRILKNCESIITVSDFEKDRIGEKLHLPGNRLVSVYNAVSPHFSPVTDEQTLQRVKKRYRLPDNFLFFFGNTDPKKNTGNVIRAYARYAQKTMNALPLVIGDYDKELVAQTLAKENASAFMDNIHFPGYLANSDMPAVLSLANTLLYPSLRESFGIPILEGMACGTPVLTSNAASMPEVSGGAAKLIDPASIDDMANGIKEITADSRLREQLILKGLERAKAFSWESTAQAYLDIYSKILKS
jgi:glycosyltransferase involved in cell wall biosynthesis